MHSKLKQKMLKKYLTKAERAEFSPTADQKEILVGLSLGDLFIQKTKSAVNPTLCFSQGGVHKEYLYHLYEKFKEFCLAEPKTLNPKPDKRTGKVYPQIRFHTCALPCFNELYKLFYENGKKIIPSNIKELITVLTLCYWLCDDGCFCKTKHIIYLCTDSFTSSEVDLLVQALNDKWDLKCRKVKGGSGYRIIIPRESLPILQSLLKDIMPSMMRHKIGL